LHETGEANPKLILINQGPDDVIIRHNTLLTQPGLGSSAMAFANALRKRGTAFAFTDNILNLGTYGLVAENPGLGATGATLLDGHFSAWTFANNVIVNAQRATIDRYPTGQSWVSSVAEVGFVDPVGLDLRLGPRSPFRNRASDGQDPGASMERLRDAFGRFMSVPSPLLDKRR